MSGKKQNDTYFLRTYSSRVGALIGRPEGARTSAVVRVVANVPSRAAFARLLVAAGIESNVSGATKAVKDFGGTYLAGARDGRHAAASERPGVLLALRDDGVSLVEVPEHDDALLGGLS